MKEATSCRIIYEQEMEMTGIVKWRIRRTMMNKETVEPFGIESIYIMTIPLLDIW